MDLSFLNAPEKPAGKHGFLRVIGDKLAFEDGTPARFWGTNLTAYALVATSRETVERQARLLSALGFNLVRFDHLDANWVDPNIFGGPRAPDTQRLDSKVLERLDWWIKCLEGEGIYVWLDLEQDRQLRAADGITAFSEISKGSPTADLQGYAYVNPSIRQAMRRFDTALLSHRNVFTGRRYLDDPGIAVLLVTNENDLTHHFGNALLPDKHVPWHDARYMRAAAAFAADWGLPERRVWRSWEPGPSKLFLNDLEHRFDVELISNLRALGVRVPIVTTSTWGENPLSSLPALTTGDIVDAHAYGGASELGRNPLDAPNMVDWLAAAQVVGRPLSVTEWNVEPFPVSDRGTIPLYIAASACLQGWDAVMQYAYSQLSLDGPGSAGNWEAHDDPALMAVMPAAALLYRRGDVREADRLYVFAPGERRLYDESVSPETSVALRTAVEKGRLVIALPKTRELPWLRPSAIPAGATVVTDPNVSLVARDSVEAMSDTGELRRDWKRGIYTIDTPLTQAAMGRIGGREIRLADVDFGLVTGEASVAVQSLDGRWIGNSRDILISLGARAQPMPGNTLPFRSEPVEGRLAIRAPRGLRLYFASSSAYDAGRNGLVEAAQAARTRSIAVPYTNGRYLIDLDRSRWTHWLVLK